MNKTTSLPVMEQFLTLQGEGRYTGHAAYFIRLGGCDVGCVWCDVKESWDMEKHPRIEINQLVENVLASNATIAVITGGEPLMHSLDVLTSELQSKGIRTHIETSGAHPVSGKWNWITLSPKKFKAALPDAIQLADELKVVVYNRSDFDWANHYAGMVKKDCLLYLQPEWSKSSELNPLIVEYIKQHPQWLLSLQTHKFLDIP
ncbi:MAG: 7-carboxy-7-deazaguanine synthase QueE [Chitinophagia bacterium]|nr:7-carboxy-7-deazaguanine synthase QueE [Chitinophagia bacterium]